MARKKVENDWIGPGTTRRQHEGRQQFADSSVAYCHLEEEGGKDVCSLWLYAQTYQKVDAVLPSSCYVTNTSKF